MTVQDVIDTYMAEANYVCGSMINKSYDDNGCAWKWLCHNESGAFRREVFMCTSTTGTLEERTVTEHVEVNDAK